MKWEYKVEPILLTDAAQAKKDMDALGKDGWELVTSTLINGTEGGLGVTKDPSGATIFQASGAALFCVWKRQA
jgi:hypothetical protein